jgi:hypothetical protein
MVYWRRYSKCTFKDAESLRNATIIIGARFEKGDVVDDLLEAIWTKIDESTRERAGKEGDGAEVSEFNKYMSNKGSTPGPYAIVIRKNPGMMNIWWWLWNKMIYLSYVSTLE